MIDGVVLSTEMSEGDALVLDSSDTVHVRNARLESALGEGVELQSGLNAEGNGMDEYPLSNIVIEAIEVPRARHAVSLSRAMTGGVNRIAVRNVSIGDAQQGIVGHVPQDVDGVVEYVIFSDIHTQTSGESVVSIDLAYPDDMVDIKHDERSPATFRDIYFSDIPAPDGVKESFRNLDHPRVIAERIFWNGRSVMKE